MMLDRTPFISIPLTTYDNLINHLEIHAVTDAWAKNCLEQLTAGGESAEISGAPFPYIPNCYLLQDCDLN